VPPIGLVAILVTGVARSIDAHSNGTFLAAAAHTMYCIAMRACGEQHPEVELALPD